MRATILFFGIISVIWKIKSDNNTKKTQTLKEATVTLLPGRKLVFIPVKISNILKEIF